MSKLKTDKLNRSIKKSRSGSIRSVSRSVSGPVSGSISSIKTQNATINTILKKVPTGLRSRSLIYMKTCQNNCFKKDIQEINNKLKLLQETDAQGHINWNSLKNTLENLKCEHRGGTNNDIDLGKKLDYIMSRLNSLEKIQISAEILDKIHDNLSSAKKSRSLNKEDLSDLYSKLKTVEEKLDTDIIERKKNEIKYSEIKSEADMKEIDRDLNYKNVLLRINDLKNTINSNNQAIVPERMTYLRDQELAKELDRAKKDREASKLKEIKYSEDIERLRAELMLLKRDRDIAIEKATMAPTPEEKENMDELVKKLTQESKDLENSIIDYIKRNQISNQELIQKHKVLHDSIYHKEDIEVINKWVPPENVNVYSTITECCKPLFSKITKIKNLALEISKIDPLKYKLLKDYSEIQTLMNQIAGYQKRIEALENKSGRGGIGENNSSNDIATITIPGSSPATINIQDLKKLLSIESVDAKTPPVDIVKALKENSEMILNKNDINLDKIIKANADTLTSNNSYNENMYKELLAKINNAPAQVNVDTAGIINEIKDLKKVFIDQINILKKEPSTQQDPKVMSDLQKSINDLNATIVALKQGLIKQEDLDNLVTSLQNKDSIELINTVNKIGSDMKNLILASTNQFKDILNKQLPQQLPQQSNDPIINQINELKNGMSKKFDDLENKLEKLKEIQSDRTNLLETVDTLKDIKSTKDIKSLRSIDRSLQRVQPYLFPVPMSPPPYPSPYPQNLSNPGIVNVSGIGNNIGSGYGNYGPQGTYDWSWRYGTKKLRESNIQEINTQKFNRFGNPIPTSPVYSVPNQQSSSEEDKISGSIIKNLINILYYEKLYNNTDNTDVNFEKMHFILDPKRELTKLAVNGSRSDILKFIRKARKYISSGDIKDQNEIKEIINISGNRIPICLEIQDPDTRNNWGCIGNQAVQSKRMIYDYTR